MASVPLTVITGAASGIGRALALRAARDEGHHVALVDIDARSLARVLAEILAEGGSASAYPLDITDSNAVALVVEQLISERGVPDLVMCNAGVEHTGRLWEMTPEEWRRVQSINVDGAFYVAQAFLPAMIERGTPSRLLFTSSVGGLAIPGFQGAYAVSKHAVRVLAQAFAVDLAEVQAPVKVSILLPAATQTTIFETATSDASSEARDYHERMLGHLEEEGITPEAVADIVFDGIREGKEWIYSHPDRGEFFVKQHVAELLAGVGA